MGLTWTGGYLVAAIADEETVDYIATEAITTDSSAHTEILCMPASKSRIRFEADCTIDTVAAQRGVAYELSTNLLLDNAAAATAGTGFLVDGLVGATGDKKLSGYFL